jgi:flagellar L-ring protein precursor FlgH
MRSRSPRAAAAVLALLLGMAGCASPPGPLTTIQPAAFPVAVSPQAASTDGSVFPSASSGSLYEPRKDWRIGDLVTIDIVTSSSAANNDDASLSRKGTLNDALTSFMGVPLTFGSMNGSPFSPSIDPNGTLALSGRTNVNVNGNVTSILVTGYASPDDIAANTTISSNNIADMNVQYVGNGPINDAHQVPWLQQILSKVAPF